MILNFESRKIIIEGKIEYNERIVLIVMALLSVKEFKIFYAEEIESILDTIFLGSGDSRI